MWEARPRAEWPRRCARKIRAEAALPPGCAEAPCGRPALGPKVSWKTRLCGRPAPGPKVFLWKAHEDSRRGAAPTDGPCRSSLWEARLCGRPAPGPNGFWEAHEDSRRGAAPTRPERLAPRTPRGLLGDQPVRNLVVSSKSTVQARQQAVLANRGGNDHAVSGITVVPWQMRREQSRLAIYRKAGDAGVSERQRYPLIERHSQAEAPVLHQPDDFPT